MVEDAPAGTTTTADTTTTTDTTTTGETTTTTTTTTATTTTASSPPPAPRPRLRSGAARVGRPGGRRCADGLRSTGRGRRDRDVRDPGCRVEHEVLAAAGPQLARWPQRVWFRLSVSSEPLARLQFALNPAQPWVSRPFRSTISVRTRLHTIWIRFADASGALSDWHRISIP